MTIMADTTTGSQGWRWELEKELTLPPGRVVGHTIQEWMKCSMSLSLRKNKPPKLLESMCVVVVVVLGYNDSY